jgi:sugar diacid utilization regulator
MIDTQQLVDILKSYGEWKEGCSREGERPFLHGDVWVIPAGEGCVLEVRQADLPESTARLLSLFLLGQEPEQDRQAVCAARVQAWLAGEAALTADELGAALAELGWEWRGAVVVTVELAQAETAEEVSVQEALQLFAELLQGRGAFLARRGRTRVNLLLPCSLPSGEADGMTSGEELAAWLDTLGAELYVLAQMGVSGVKRDAQGLLAAQVEAEFALEAGKKYRQQERVHHFERLGLARLMHGVPPEVREAFLAEVLPEEVLAGLSLELRETIFTFLEAGGQLADTARRLYVHRNTLLYRLERIQELTGRDLRQPIEGWTLWMALMMSRTPSGND